MARINLSDSFSDRMLPDRADERQRRGTNRTRYHGEYSSETTMSFIEAWDDANPYLDDRLTRDLSAFVGDAARSSRDHKSGPIIHGPGKR
ncbi:MAG: hypothetical protein ABIQ19_12045, partial [Sphingomonas sp.]